MDRSPLCNSFFIKDSRVYYHFHEKTYLFNFCNIAAGNSESLEFSFQYKFQLKSLEYYQLFKMKNIKVSVGLSVFNEGNNIANVIHDILHQKQEGWKLMEVLVFDDGSNDSTVKKAKGINNRLLKIVEDGTKKGKTHRLSQMFKTFKGEVLVMFDGDVRLVGENVITKLVESFNDPFTMLVGGNSQPFSPKNFFQRAVYTTFSVFYRSRIMVRGGNNIFGCTGSILAIRNTLARKIMMPSVINEDAYIYLYCLNEKYKFSYQDKARVMYK